MTLAARTPRCGRSRRCASPTTATSTGCSTRTPGWKCSACRCSTCRPFRTPMARPSAPRACCCRSSNISSSWGWASACPIICRCGRTSTRRSRRTSTPASIRRCSCRRASCSRTAPIQVDAFFTYGELQEFGPDGNTIVVSENKFRGYFALKGKLQHNAAVAIGVLDPADDRRYLQPPLCAGL